MQPGKSLEAKSCCWSPSRSAELLAWVCLGGKWDVGWDLGSLRLGNCHGGVPADGPGELFPETSPRSCVEGKRPGNSLMALRGVARVHVPQECLTTWWGRSRPSPKSCGVQSLPRGSPRSSLRGGKRVSHVLQHTVGCGMGQIQPIRARSTARGRSRPSPLHQGHSGSQGPLGPPFPAPQLWGCPFILHPLPASLNHHGGTGVKSCPNLFLAVLQLGINGLGRAVGKCLLHQARPLCSIPCVKVSTANLHFSGIL